MITSLITALRDNDIEPTAKELADALWFAMQIKPFVAPVTVSKKISPSPQSEFLLDEPMPEIQDSEDIISETVKPKSYSVLPKTSGATGSNSGIPIRVPATTMLPGILSLERALRPLMRRIESRTRYVLDEAATVRRIAEQDIWLPVSKGVAERWFEVVLVIDQSASMVIWQPTISEWSHLLQRHGAFRNVRSFAMKYEGQRVQLYAGSRSCSPRELLNSSGRRLILVVSDCVSPAWYSGAITQLLELWGQSNAVAIVQMLPQRLWTGSGLGKAMRVNLRATTPGLANAKLIVDEDWFADNLPTGMKMPVVTLEPESLQFWARSLMGKRNAWISGVIFEPSANQQEITSSIKPASKISAEQRLQHFYATASPTAQEFAGYLAAAPLTLPVMRLVQRVMLPESRQVHLAEVFLGGLIKRVSAQECNPMVMEYDFHDGVRDLLLDSVLIPDAVDVLKEVSKYLEKRLGNPLDFMALLVDPTAIDGVVIDEENRAFAEIGAGVLGRFGGEYGKLAEKIKLEKMYSEIDYEWFLAMKNRTKHKHLLQHYLLIELIQLESKSGYNVVQAWLFISSENIKYVYLSSNNILNDMPFEIRKVLEIICNFDVNHEQLTIEFILPTHLLNYSVEHWTDEADIPIGTIYPVVVRPSLRFHHGKKLQRFWHQLWNNAKEKYVLQEIAKTHTLINETKLLKLRVDEDKLCFVSTSIPEKELFVLLIKSGVPIALWPKHINNIETLKPLLDKLLSCTLEQLPHCIFEIRKKLWVENKLQHVGFHLSLFWDDPDRMPPRMVMPAPD